MTYFTVASICRRGATMTSLHQFHERGGGLIRHSRCRNRGARNFHASRTLSVILDSMVKMAS